MNQNFQDGRTVEVSDGLRPSLAYRSDCICPDPATRCIFPFYRISLMSRIIDREKFLDNCIHTFLSVHSDIQQPYTCTIYTRVLVYRYRSEHALLLRTRAQASRCCGLHRCPSSCLSLHSSSSSGGGSSRWGLRWHGRPA